MMGMGRIQPLKSSSGNYQIQATRRDRARSKDPWLNALPSGQSVCNADLATHERWTERETGERKERTRWYRITPKSFYPLHQSASVHMNEVGYLAGIYA